MKDLILLALITFGAVSLMFGGMCLAVVLIRGGR